MALANLFSQTRKIAIVFAAALMDTAITEAKAVGNLANTAFDTVLLS